MSSRLYFLLYFHCLCLSIGAECRVLHDLGRGLHLSWRNLRLPSLHSLLGFPPASTKLSTGWGFDQGEADVSDSRASIPTYLSNFCSFISGADGSTTSFTCPMAPGSLHSRAASSWAAAPSHAAFSLVTTTSFTISTAPHSDAISVTNNFFTSSTAPRSSRSRADSSHAACRRTSFFLTAFSQYYEKKLPTVPTTSWAL